MAKTEHGSTNIFNITKPTAYRCQIFHYHRKLSRLYISIYQGQKNVPAFYILFSDVGYIEAPMSWMSADFEIADKQACIDLMLRVGLVGEAILQFPDAYASITDYARLYQIHTLHQPIRIIASSGTLMNHVPIEIQ
jgi:hypothetical protein